MSPEVWPEDWGRNFSLTYFGWPGYKPGPGPAPLPDPTEDVRALAIRCDAGTLRARMAGAQLRGQAVDPRDPDEALVAAYWLGMADAQQGRGVLMIREGVTDAQQSEETPQE